MNTNLATRYRSPQLLSVRTAGFEARLEGSSRFACPYAESGGWGQAFAAAWVEGWNAADQVTDPPSRPFPDRDYTEPKEAA